MSWSDGKDMGWLSYRRDKTCFSNPLPTFAALLCPKRDIRGALCPQQALIESKMGVHRAGHGIALDGEIAV